MNLQYPIVAQQMLIREMPKETGEELLRRVIREEVIRAMTKMEDRKSFAAAGEFMTLAELGEYTTLSRTLIYEMRAQRKMAKTEAMKDKACFPEYQISGTVRFKRSDIDLWMEGQRI